MLGLYRPTVKNKETDSQRKTDKDTDKDGPDNAK